MDHGRPSITVYPRKGAAALLLVVALAMTATCVAYVASHISWNIGASAMDALMALGALTFGVGAISEAMMLCSSAPVIEVDERGICITDGLWSVGLISWDEIAVVSVDRIRYARFLAIDPRNLGALIARQMIVPKVMLLLNAMIGYTSILIPQVWLSLSGDELLHQISKQFAAEVRQYGVGIALPPRRRSSRTRQKAGRPRS